MIFSLIIVGLLVIARTPATKLAADLIPRSWERMLGKAVFMAVSSSTKMLDDAEIASALQKELEPLLAVTAKSGYTFEFHISRELDTNAFALPGGSLVINAGTILKSSRAEELLGVVAHEMAHVTNRHSTRQIVTLLGLYAVADIVFGGTIGMIAAGGQGAVYLLRQGFSRDQEREADREGLQYLNEARIDPFGLVEFFTKGREEQQRIPLVGSVEQYVGFLNTHPGTDERIDYLKSQIIAGGEREILPRDTGTFISLQERVKKSLGLGEQQK
jgi:predicted Zn-dependent protease